MPEILTSFAEGVFAITLNRPSALNSLTPELVAGLQDAIDTASADKAVRSVVITGAGRAFCAGSDLKASERRSKIPRANVAFIEAIGKVMSSLESCGKPVLAAVNGHAVAGGLELVLACDFVIASETAKLGDAHSNYAMFPGGGATVRLPRRVGLASAKRLMFFGDLLSAKDAAAIGLVDQVVPADELIERTQSLARRLSAKSPLVIARMKAALNDSLSLPLEIGYRRERDLNELHALSDDRREGLAAFREKRTPVFSGF
mgnify:CR=1 FL=1